MPMTLLLKCCDLEQTRDYYADVLGFDVADSANNTCSVQFAGATLIFSTGEQWGEQPLMTGTVYIFVVDVEQYYRSVHARVTLLWPLQTMPWGIREFGIADCNGYHLAFAQDAHTPEASQ